jgi:hypothetical protein
MNCCDPVQRGSAMIELGARQRRLAMDRILPYYATSTSASRTRPNCLRKRSAILFCVLLKTHDLLFLYRRESISSGLIH